MKKIMALLIAVTMFLPYVSISMSASAETTTTQNIPDGYAGYYSLGSFGDESKEKNTDIGTGISFDFNYTVLDNGTVEITYYKGKSGDVVIPSEIDGKSVSAISDCAFYNCINIISITIPDSITSIGDYAFASCENLKSITIPDSVTFIGNYAFSCCSSLTNIIISDSITSIGNYAFANCGLLSCVTIPDSVISIGDSAFSNCSSLTNVTLPDGVTAIGNWAFEYCSSITSIMIPDGVTFIGDSVFSNCSSLSSITISDSVTSIGDKAFSYCSNLKSITIPNGVTSIGDQAFSYCSNLKSISIPNSVTSIGSRVFYSCWGLEDVYYLGTKEEWNSIYISADNDTLTSANIYCNGIDIDVSTDLSTDIPSDIRGTIFFDATEWNSEKVYFYIWDETDDTYATQDGWVEKNPWGSKKLSGTPVKGRDGVFESYEIKFKDEHDIFVIFYDPDTGSQTESCKLDSSKIGYTVKPIVDSNSAPSDNDKKVYKTNYYSKNNNPVGTIFFDASEWKSSKIYFFIWDETDDTFANKNGWVYSNTWGSKKLAGTLVEGTDYVFESYEIEFIDNHDLYLIFYDPNSGAQTYDCVLNSSAMGDTAYITGVCLENPVDNDRTCIEARFQNADCGPKLEITSSGKIVGEYIAPNINRPKQVAQFVYKYYGKKDSVSGNDIVTVENVANAIEAFSTNADDVWSEFQNFDDDPYYKNYHDIKDGAEEIIFATVTDINKPDIPVDPIGIYGDMTGDDRINSIDALYVQRFTIGYSELTDEEKIIADVNIDGRVNSIDTLIILRYCAGYTENTHVGQYIYPVVLE